MCRFVVTFWVSATFMALFWSFVQGGALAENGAKLEESIVVKEKLTKKIGPGLSHISFSPDGKSLAFSIIGGPTKPGGIPISKIGILDVASGIEKQKFITKGLVSAIAWEPNGRRLVAGFFAPENKIECLDIETGKVVFSVGTKSWIVSISYHPNGKEFAAAGSGEKTIELRDWEKGGVVRTIPQTSAVRIAFAPNGKTLAAMGTEKTITINDTASGEVLMILKGHEDNVVSISFDASGRWLASASFDKTAKIWDAKSGELVRTIPSPTGASKVAFTPDGKWVAIASSSSARGEGVVSLRERETGREVVVLEKQSSGADGLAFSRDGTLLVAAFGRVLHIWEVSTKKAPAAEKGK